ncbi:crotonase/enoyl-CoA hydratase family protein [Aquabacterium sp.]|uniref:crotonase/enoyl-CoA hydratase family protein n=1 Tax=Aquabacterium sp. TaxID=1872578 RepID=UPI0027BB1061|nr:crotonase/enoyl-CoA hydratase family protein [Aquabacterium sp.]
MQFETLAVSVDQHIATVKLNRPDKANAMNWQMWQDIRSAMQWADRTPEVRVVIVEGEGKHFTSGIDLTMMMGLQAQIKDDCEGRSREKLRALVLELQDTLSSIERCRKPVLAAIHNGCVGGGVDLISCTDMRYCSADAYFTIKEIDIGMVADVGTLQRLPKLIGNQGIVREMAFTGRKVLADEALRIGLVNQVFETREAMQAGVREMAALIASKSPLSIRGTKEMLNYSRDHSVADGLSYIATWNAAMLMSGDLTTAMMASMAKQTPQFKD